jgi:hypothetical protein
MVKKVERSTKLNYPLPREVKVKDRSPGEVIIKATEIHYEIKEKKNGEEKKGGKKQMKAKGIKKVLEATEMANILLGGKTKIKL